MPLSPVKEDPDGPKRPRSSLFEDPSQDQNLTLTPVTEDPVVHDPDPAMPLSPIVVRLKRHRSSLFEDPSHDQNLTPVTEDSDVAKRPRSSLSSEHPDIQGGKHPDPDPAKPLKPVSRTLKEILDEAGPLISKERELEYAKIFAKRKEAEPITNRVTGFGGPINVVQSYEAKPITNRVMASFPEPLLGGRINVGAGAIFCLGKISSYN